MLKNLDNFNFNFAGDIFIFIIKSLSYMKKLLIILGLVLGVAVFYQCEKSTTVEQEKNIESIDSRSVNTSNDDVSAGAAETLGGCFDGSGCDLIGKKKIYTDLHMQGTCDNFTAWADIYVCDGEIVFTNFNFSPCNKMYEYYVLLSDEELAIALDSFYNAASIIYEANYLEENYSLYLCGSGNEKATAFVSSLCYRWCVNYDGGPAPGPVSVSIGKVICGEKCCKRSAEVCIDENGKLQFNNVTYTSYGEDSCSNTIKGECRGRLIGDCEHDCGN